MIWKKVFRIVFYNGGLFIDRLLNGPKILIACKIAKAYFYSGLIRRRFKHCGTDFWVEPPYYFYGVDHIRIGNNFRSFKGLRLETHSIHLGNSYNPSLVIGDNVSINFDCHIGCINKVNIGNNVLLASRVFITDHFHGEILGSELHIPPSQRSLFSKGPVIIEDNVWIGEGVIIMPNVTIGKNSIIGANSVVTKSFPDNSVIVGCPAKIIKILNG